MTEKPDRIQVTLVGGPAHGAAVNIRADRRRIEVPYAPDAPDIGEGQRVLTELKTFTLVYLRANEGALTAEYHDMEMDR